jgi:hypothetical protein
MKEKLEEIDSSKKDEVSRESSYIEVIKSHTYGLKNFLYQYKFASQEEEIEFFKHIKPKFVSLLLFHNELFEIELSRPLEREYVIKHYHDAISKVQTYINSNLELFKYYYSGSTCLDSKYFLSDQNKETGTDVMYDSKFCTPFDHKFCMLKANELLKEHLTLALERLQERNKTSVCILQWTGNKTSLIELVYALQASGCFNKSKSDLKMIANYFEKVFNVNLGNYYRKVRDIQVRKGGKTVFLDELKEKLQVRLDREIDA